MVHALTLLVVILVAAPLAKHIPLCVLAAILMVVAYNMAEWDDVPEILKTSRADIAVWTIAFALTVLADLTVAVGRDDTRRAALYPQSHLHDDRLA
jgi:SulP family sulfate permease